MRIIDTAHLTIKFGSYPRCDFAVMDEQALLPDFSELLQDAVAPASALVGAQPVVEVVVAETPIAKLTGKRKAASDAIVIHESPAKTPGGVYGTPGQRSEEQNIALCKVMRQAKKLKYQEYQDLVAKESDMQTEKKVRRDMLVSAFSPHSVTCLRLPCECGSWTAFAWSSPSTSFFATRENLLSESFLKTKHAAM